MDDLSDGGFGMAVNRWVRRIYLALIFGTISACCFTMARRGSRRLWRRAARQVRQWNG